MERKKKSFRIGLSLDLCLESMYRTRLILNPTQWPELIVAAGSIKRFC